MPWWAVVYVGLFGVLSAGGIWDDYRDQRPAWFLSCALVSNLTVIYLFVSFWHPSFRSPLGLVAPSAFVASAGWELFQAIEDLRALRADKASPEASRLTSVTITAIALSAACLPAFVVAGVSAFGS